MLLGMVMRIQNQFRYQVATSKFANINKKQEKASYGIGARKDITKLVKKHLMELVRKRDIMEFEKGNVNIL